MRSKIDLKVERGKKKRKSPAGGKALQRLFFYLSERDPAINDDVVAMIAPRNAARPKFGLTRRALRAKKRSAA